MNNAPTNFSEPGPSSSSGQRAPRPTLISPYIAGPSSRSMDPDQPRPSFPPSSASTENLASGAACGAELIAMTTHGRSALGRLLFGSVAEAVLRQTHVLLFIVRATEAGEETK